MVELVRYGAEDPGDPAWRDARARYGKLAPLLRLVDPAAGTDEIVALPALPEHMESALDGCCLVRLADGSGALHRRP